MLWPSRDGHLVTLRLGLADVAMASLSWAVHCRTGQLLDVIEDPAAVPWKQASFNFYDKRIMGDAWLQEARPAVIKEFFCVLAVCHTVIPDGDAPMRNLFHTREMQAMCNVFHCFCCKQCCLICLAKCLVVGDVCHCLC